MEIWFLVWLFPFGAQGRPRSRGTPVGPLQGAQAKECGTGMHAYALDEQTQAFHWAKSQSRKNYPENTTSHPPLPTRSFCATKSLGRNRFFVLVNAAPATCKPANMRVANKKACGFITRIYDISF